MSVAVTPGVVGCPPSWTSSQAFQSSSRLIDESDEALRFTHKILFSSSATK